MSNRNRSDFLSLVEVSIASQSTFSDKNPLGDRLMLFVLRVCKCARLIINSLRLSSFIMAHSRVVMERNTIDL